MRYKGLWYNPDKPEPERIEHDNTIFIFSFVFSSFRAFVIIKFFHKMTLTAKKRSGQEIRIALPARSLPTRRHPESFLPDKSTCFRFRRHRPIICRLHRSLQRTGPGHKVLYRRTWGRSHSGRWTGDLSQPPHPGRRLCHVPITAAESRTRGRVFAGVRPPGRRNGPPAGRRRGHFCRLFIGR